MATFTVTTADDELDDNFGTGAITVANFGGFLDISLREAIALANATAASDNINFSAAQAGSTITLTLGELDLTTDINIDGDVDGDDKADITVSGNNASRVFSISGFGTDVDLTSLTITDGNAGNIATYGGGIQVLSNTSLDLSNSSVVGNSAGYGGGISSFGDVTISASTIADNSVIRFGGGISSDAGGTLVIENTTLANNSASVGGGVRSFADATITSSTLTGNSASSADGGGAIDINGILTLTSSIVAGNNSGGGTSFADVDLNTSGSLVSDGANIFGGNVTGNVAGDVELGFGNSNTVAEVFETIDGSTGGGALADNGGPVETVALLANAINPALDNATVPAGLTTDARGFARDVDQANSNNGGTMDSGAFELQSQIAPGSLFVTTALDVVDFSDGMTSLREAVAFANSNPDQSDITFETTLAGSTIVLTQGQLELLTDLSINGDVSGDQKADITVSGNHASRVFSVAGFGTDVDLTSLTITDGNAGNSLADGGGIQILTGASLDLRHSSVIGNSAGEGGGIYSGGDLTVRASTIADNSAAGSGGGISSFAGTLLIENTTIANNSGGTGGGLRC